MVNNGVGISGHTFEKLNTFQSIVKTHLAIANRVIQKHHYYDRSYWYIDITAGPGRYEGFDGSPLVFLKEAIQQPGILFNVVLIEINNDNFDVLLRATDVFREYSNINLFMERGDHRELLKKYYGVIGPKRIGLIYCDPTGNIPDFDLLSETSIIRLFTSTDFLVYMSAANAKRVALSPLCKESRRLSDFLETINKDWWQLREPIGRHQWTFLFGSNYRFPEFRTIKFHSRDSKEGRGIWETLCTTSKEREGI
jgi:three-Cys-motif partner protein